MSARAAPARRDGLDEEAYLNKITQLFFFRKKLSLATTKRGPRPRVPRAQGHRAALHHPRLVFDDLISGMEDDLYQNRYRTFDDLYVYCYRVASVVGLMCIEIYGMRTQGAQIRESWGIFMQLTNVLRDVGEDIHRDRVYLPSEELEANDLDPNEFMDGRVILNTSWEPTATTTPSVLAPTLRKPGNSFRFCPARPATRLRR